MFENASPYNLNIVPKIGSNQLNNITRLMIESKTSFNCLLLSIQTK